MVLKKQISILLALIIMLFSLTACGTGEKVSTSNHDQTGKKTIKIGYLPITHAVPLYMESNLKNKNFKIELVKFGTWPELMDALNTGRIDGASVLIQLAMKAKEQGIDLKAVALGHRDGNVLIGAKNINKVTDLKGKTFAIPNKYSTHNILLYQMLKKAGMKYSDVNVVELPPAEMPAALSEGRIAGYVVAEPFGAISVSLGKGKVLYQSQDIWKDSIDCALVLRNDWIKSDHELAKEFVNEYVKAGKLAQAKDEHTYEVTSKYIKVDKKVLDLSLKWISYDNLRIDKAAYEKLRESLLEMKLSENPPKYEDFVDSSLIDK